MLSRVHRSSRICAWFLLFLLAVGFWAWADPTDTVASDPVLPDLEKQTDKDETKPETESSDEAEADDGIAPLEVEHTPFKPSPMPKIDGKNDKVLIIELHEQFSPPLLYRFRRAHRIQKNDPHVRAVIIDMDTPGGRVDVLGEIIALINDFSVPVYLFVRNDAMSAGALLSFATNGIYMTPASRIGAAAVILIGPQGADEPKPRIREKFNSAMRSTVRALAEKNGFRQEVGVAMIDQDYKLAYGDKVVCPKGRLLTLTAKEATEKMPDGNQLHAHGLVDDIQALLELKKLQHAEKLEILPSAADTIARFLTMLAPFLLFLAIIGIYTEMNTPGFGIPGGLGITCLILAVFGHHIAGLSGWEEMIVILIGLILLAVEIFVIPGFGVCGVLGILAIFGGFVWMMIPHIPSAPPSLPELDIVVGQELNGYLAQALINLVMTIVLCILGFFLLRKYLPKTTLFKRLVLQHATTKEAGYSGSDEKENIGLVGLTGTAMSDLRPSGIALIDNRRVDVVTRGEYIEANSDIRVKEVKGVRVVVVKAPKSETADDPGDEPACESSS